MPASSSLPKKAVGSNTLLSLLRACAKQKDLQKGSSLHASLVRKGLLETNVFVGSTLINLYAKCGALAQAQEVLDQLPTRNVVCWNALITGYAQHGHGKEALRCFDRMQHEGLSPDAVTFACILKACGSVGAADKGQGLHAQIADGGLLRTDIVIGTALVDMYAKCHLLGKAQEVFDQLLVRNVVSWTALIGGYAEHGRGEEALKCFEQMEQGGLPPNAITFIYILKACGSTAASDKGQDIHGEILRLGLLKEEGISTALVDMYAKCGLLSKAQEVCHNLLAQSVDSWNALIAGYVQHGHGKEAVSSFKQMQHDAFSPDAITFACILKACGMIGAADKGEEVHAQIYADGSMGKETVVGTALVDMYAKCGLLERAQDVFDKLPVRDVCLWNATISGYAQFGMNELVFESFDRMIGEGEEPDLATFTIVLNACSHRGLVDKGQMYFEAMSMHHGIIPTLEHHSCMINLLSRSGCIDKAVALIKDMPFSANLAVWHTLLGACQKGSNMNVGRVAFEHALQLDEEDAAAYVSMRNIHAAADRQSNVGTMKHLCVGVWGRERERELFARKRSL